MEDQKIFKYNSFSFIVFVFVINILFLKGIKSAEYIVGGDQDQWNTQADFGSWSQQYNFSVGDVLVFKYTKGQHNVYEVTHTTYQSCDASNGGVLAKYESGNDQITLTDANKYWFICNIAGHCLGGMRFSIGVKEANPTINTSSGSTPPSSTPPPMLLEPTNGCIISSSLGIWHIEVYIVALFGLSRFQELIIR